ncbi:MAG: hypothetical protein M1837_006119 [Sclerophora amabilis]|nr:MAG: hypothetical protein M1837_006119 [Sclerophora amabilis]
MTLISESHDSLPYIDALVSAEQRDAAINEISQELPADYQTVVHPSIPDLPPTKLSELMEIEVDRRAADQQMEGGVDTTRYQALEPPPTDPESDENRPQVLEQWRDTLRKAYASSTHIQTRMTNLALLEEFGKNAWLIGNSQLEDVLRSLERELAATLEETENLNKARQISQESVRGELETLQESWQQGIGKVIEVEVASEGLRQDILRRRREGAQGV